MDTTDQPARTRITPQLRALRFDAGSMSLNLSATVGRRGGAEIERLTGPDRLREWCAGVGVDLRRADQTAEFVAELHEFRAAVYEVLHAAVHDRLPDKASVAMVNRVAEVAPPAARLRGLRLELPVLTGAELKSVIARDLLAVVADRSRLRECDSEVCRMIYVDSPGGRPRKWCSMQRCGNQAKAAQHRLKAATRA